MVEVFFSIDKETFDREQSAAAYTTPSTHAGNVMEMKRCACSINHHCKPLTETIASNIESAVRADQVFSNRDPALQHDSTVKPQANDIYDAVPSGGNKVDRQTHVRTLPRAEKFICSNCQELRRECQHLSYYNQNLTHEKQILLRENQSLLHDNHRLHRESCASQQNQNLASKLRQLQATNADLSRQNDELRRKYSKYVARYKELDRSYMELVRPLHVSGNDYSSIYNRLVHIRVSIETLIQKAKGDVSVNLNKEAAIAHFKEAGLLQDFPVPESHLEPYHLNLFMESATMAVLINHFFNRSLECIFDQSEEFKMINKWIEDRDDKIATRWRQQLYLLIAQDSQAMERRRDEEVRHAGMTLFNLVSKVYRDVDMSIKIRELCCNAFDLSVAMVGMETMICPVPTPLGAPFDSTTMLTPQIESRRRGLIGDFSKFPRQK